MRIIDHTNKIDDAVGNAQSASSLNTAADVLDLSAELALVSIALALELGKERLSEGSEAGDDVATNQLLGLGDVALLRDLHLELAAAEAKVHDLLHVGDFAAGQQRIVFGDLVATGDTEINTAFTDEGGDICGGKENEGDGKVLDQSDVQTGFATELDVAAGQEVQRGLLETALCSGTTGVSPVLGLGAIGGLGNLGVLCGQGVSHGGNLLLGTAKSSLPSRL